MVSCVCMCPIALARVAKLFAFEAFFCVAGTPPLSFSDIDLTRSLASTHAFWSPFGVLFVLFCVRAAVFVSAPMLVLVACLIHCFFGGLALVWHFLACFLCSARNHRADAWGGALVRAQHLFRGLVALHFAIARGPSLEVKAGATRIWWVWHSMHACMVCMHAWYACRVCMHSMHACMHSMHACIVCMHA